MGCLPGSLLHRGYRFGSGVLLLIPIALCDIPDLTFYLGSRLDGAAFCQLFGRCNSFLLYCSLDGLFFLDFSGDIITSSAAHRNDGRRCTYERFSLGRVDIKR